jgi:hypothetical protein
MEKLCKMTIHKHGAHFWMLKLHNHNQCEIPFPMIPLSCQTDEKCKRYDHSGACQGKLTFSAGVN